MRKGRKTPPLGRLARSQTLLSRTEQVLREAITRGGFPDQRLPTAVELAEQLGVSRETVRLAQDALQKEGLLVKYRRKGTLIEPPAMTLRRPAARSTLIGYLQADFPSPRQEDEAVTAATSGLMLQGAMRESGRAGLRLVVHHAPHTELDRALGQLTRETPLHGVIFASFGDEKLIRQSLGLGLPAVLLDHELNLPTIPSVREDSQQGARIAVSHLAGLGHRRIAYANWHIADLNPWRTLGYRKGLSEARLPRRRAWEFSTEITEAGADAMVEKVLRLHPRPTAIICFNNTLARFTIESLRRRRVGVPDQLSIFGIGGEEVTGLACAQADWMAMGRDSVKMLLETASGRAAREPEHRLFPYDVRPGRTAGPPPPDRS